MLIQLTLERLEDDVQHAVGVQVEVADDALDDFQHLSGADRGEILVQLRDQLAVAFALFSEEVELLLLVAGGKEEYWRVKVSRKKVV